MTLKVKTNYAISSSFGNNVKSSCRLDPIKVPGYSEFTFGSSLKNNDLEPVKTPVKSFFKNLFNIK